MMMSKDLQNRLEETKGVATYTCMRCGLCFWDPGKVIHSAADLLLLSADLFTPVTPGGLRRHQVHLCTDSGAGISPIVGLLPLVQVEALEVEIAKHRALEKASSPPSGAN